MEENNSKVLAKQQKTSSVTESEKTNLEVHEDLKAIALILSLKTRTINKKKKMYIHPTGVKITLLYCLRTLVE